jgi:uncharacterized ParB-like nuclease family protein
MANDAKVAEVEELLRDPLSRNNSDAAIARLAEVGAHIVKAARKRIDALGPLALRGSIEALDIDKLRLDGGTQPREAVIKEKVTEYALTIRGGKRFPPIGVVFDGIYYWVWDGFHRVHAHRKIRRTKILAEVKRGDREDAILLSASANAEHGIARTNEDKRRAIKTALFSPKTQDWSSRQIAEWVGVDDKTVASARSNMHPTAELPQLGASDHRLGADGKYRKPPKPKAPKQETGGDDAVQQSVPSETEQGSAEPVAQPQVSGSTVNGHQEAEAESGASETVEAGTGPEPGRESRPPRVSGPIIVPPEPRQAARVLRVHFSGERLALLIRCLQEA